MGRKSLFVLGASLALALAGCGGGSNSIVNNPPPQGNSAAVTLTVRDTPPAGVAVLSFEVTITRAVLQPGNVVVVSSPVKIEVKQLEVESAFISTLNVAAGTYTSIDVTFSNPEVTFKNTTAAAIAGCGAGAVCERQANVTATASYSGAPFPITITANNPTGFLVDVNLDNIIQNDLTVNFAAAAPFTVVQLPLPGRPAGQLEEMEDLVGTVSNKDAANNQFTLQTAVMGDLVIKVDNNTVFEDFDRLATPCTANPQNFTCVQNGQAVEVDVRMAMGGTLTAKKVELRDEVNQEEVEGLVVGNITATGFDMVVHAKTPNVTGANIGNLLHINLLPAVQFRVDSSGLSIGGLVFSAPSDLVVGQRVEIKKAAAIIAGTPPSVDASRVTLKKSSVTGTITAISGADITIGSLPALFTSAGITQIVVRTSASTSVEGPASVGALQVGNIISARGLLFRTASDPVMIAKRVRKR
jgi:hypothetical protein